MPVAYLRALVDHWLTEYDWRTAEHALNSHPQFTTDIGGVGVHFLHVRSAEPNALPLLLTHGWRGSIVEFLDLIGPLTDPRAHGQDPADAFDLVIPSVPGYGFSAAPTTAGWSTSRIAAAWAELMSRLGYHRYGAQGGDVGAFVSLGLGREDHEHVVGVHLNMLLTVPGPTDDLSDLDATDRSKLARLERFDSELSGYLKLQSTRPQTLAYALTDSPVGQLAWIVEKFAEWTDADFAPEGVIDRDVLLTNATLYWLTASAGSSAQIYYEDARRLHEPGGLPPVAVPAGVAVFPKDIFLPVRSLAERELTHITRWTEFDRGGHFAALEQPTLLLEDIRTFFRELR